MLLEMRHAQLTKLLTGLPTRTTDGTLARVLAEMVENVKIYHAYSGDEGVDFDQRVLCWLQHSSNNYKMIKI